MSRKDISNRLKKTAEAYEKAADCYDDTAKTVSQCKQSLTQSLSQSGISLETSHKIVSGLEKPTDQSPETRGGEAANPSQ